MVLPPGQAAPLARGDARPPNARGDARPPNARGDAGAPDYSAPLRKKYLIILDYAGEMLIVI